MLVYFMIILLFILSPITTEGGQSAKLNSKAPNFSLKDQHDKLFNLRSLEGEVVVLIASDKDGREQNDLWGKKIKERYKDKITILGIADLRKVPFFMKGKIREDFKRDEVSILLDWGGDVFDTYGLTKKVSNIILIDKTGYVRYTYSGDATKEAVEHLFREIDKLLN